MQIKHNITQMAALIELINLQEDLFRINIILIYLSVAFVTEV